MGITDPDPAMATTVATRPLTTVMAGPPIMGADHIITADTDMAPSFPISAVIRWPAGNSRVRNRPQGSPVPSPLVPWTKVGASYRANSALNVHSTARPQAPPRGEKRMFSLSVEPSSAGVMTIGRRHDQVGGCAQFNH